jgi:tetratricopeptide (TPR) repeat protein
MNKINKTLLCLSILLLINALDSNLMAQVVDSLARKDIQKIQISLENTKNLSEIASLIISWTGLIITTFAVILVLVSVYTGIQIKEIRKTKEEIKHTLIEAKIALKEQNQAIENLKAEFEKEKDLHLKLMFPLIEGEYCFQRGDYDKAYYYYREAKEISPNHPWLKNFSWLLINTGQIDEAIENLESLLKQAPNDKEAKYYLAHAYRRNDQLDIAEQIIKPVAIELKYRRALYEYASILLRKNDFENAERLFIETNRYYPKHADLFVYLNLSITQTILQKHEPAKGNAIKAVEMIEEELLKTPSNAHLLLQLGVAKLLLNLKDGLVIIKSSITKGLPSENAKSAIDKLEKLQKIKPTSINSEAIGLLEKYYYKK